jgi:hypothetical protein
MMREGDEKLTRQMKHRGGKISIEELIRNMCKEEGVRDQELKTGGSGERYRGGGQG